MPTNLGGGTDENRVIALPLSDLRWDESPLAVLVDRSSAAGNGGAKVVAFQYCATTETRHLPDSALTAPGGTPSRWHVNDRRCRKRGARSIAQRVIHTSALSAGRSAPQDRCASGSTPFGPDAMSHGIAALLLTTCHISPTLGGGDGAGLRASALRSGWIRLVTKRHAEETTHE
jgi:hypothetical protein